MPTMEDPGFEVPPAPWEYDDGGNDESDGDSSSDSQGAGYAEMRDQYNDAGIGAGGTGQTDSGDTGDYDQGTGYAEMREQYNDAGIGAGGTGQTDNGDTGGYDQGAGYAEMRNQYNDAGIGAGGSAAGDYDQGRGYAQMRNEYNEAGIGAGGGTPDDDSQGAGWNAMRDQYNAAGIGAGGTAPSNIGQGEGWKLMRDQYNAAGIGAGGSPPGDIGQGEGWKIMRDQYNEAGLGAGGTVPQPKNRWEAATLPNLLAWGAGYGNAMGQTPQQMAEWANQSIQQWNSAHPDDQYPLVQPVVGPKMPAQSPDKKLTQTDVPWYDPKSGRWIQPASIVPGIHMPNPNRRSYVNNDPTNRTNSTGQVPNLSGPLALARCFDLSVGSLGLSLPLYGTLRPVTAQQAVDICRAAYSKENWDLTPTAKLPTSANELMGWFVNDYRGNSNSDRLYFDAAQPLTKELSKSILVERLRFLYYHEGFETTEPMEYQFRPLEFIQSTLFDTPVSGGTNLPLTSFMGSFWVQVKTLDAPGGSRIGFRIDNDTTLASGSHFLGRSERGDYKQSVEGVIAEKPWLADEPLVNVWKGEKVVSILSSRTREDAPGGGANLYQTFTWTEKVDDSLHWNVKDWTFDLWMLYRHSGHWESRLDTGEWEGYKKITQDPPGFPSE